MTDSPAKLLADANLSTIQAICERRWKGIAPEFLGECYLAAVDMLERFDPSKGTADAYLRMYLADEVNRRIFGRGRDKRRHRDSEVAYLRERGQRIKEGYEDTSTEDRELAGRAMLILRGSIGGELLLASTGGVTREELAAQSNRSAGWVSWIISRARDHVRAALSDRQEMESNRGI